jgi:ABC-type proline/glycine betaine transport system permease subunit
MYRNSNRHSGEMLLAFAAWLCTLPLIALLVVPIWGLYTAGMVAVLVLAAILAVCWSACGWQIIFKQRSSG